MNNTRPEDIRLSSVEAFAEGPVLSISKDSNLFVIIKSKTPPIRRYGRTKRETSRKPKLFFEEFIKVSFKIILSLDHLVFIVILAHL